MQPSINDLPSGKKFLKLIELVYEDLAPITAKPGAPAPAGTSTTTASLSGGDNQLKAAVVQKQNADSKVKTAEVGALQAQINKLKTNK